MEKIKDIVRLEASTPEEVARLIEKYAKQYFDYEVKIDNWPNIFSEEVAAHYGLADGSKQDQYMAGFIGPWAGRIKGKDVGNSFDKKADFFSISRERGFKGINSGTGGYGGEFHLGGYILIEDFPKMKVLYDEWLLLFPKKVAYDRELDIRKALLDQKQEYAIKEDPLAGGLRDVIREATIALRKRCAELQSQIKNENAAFLQLPASYDYDKNRFCILNGIFGDR